MRRPALRLTTVLLTSSILLAAGTAAAGNYKGYGETNFVHDRKRDCCDAALDLAAQDSALRCERAGGFADYDPRRVRGSCSAEWRQDGRGHLWYACRASVTVRCR